MNKTLKRILILLLVAVCIMAIVITLYLINLHRHALQFDGPSMEPTITNNQVIIWKEYSHGKVPQPNDLIVFTQSGTAQYGIDKNVLKLVKRVVGVPGDHVVISNNTLTVINGSHPNGYNPDTFANKGRQLGRDIDINLQSDEYFVLGDNIENSLDSRVFGAVKRNEIQGYVDLSSSKWINDNRQ